MKDPTDDFAQYEIQPQTSKRNDNVIITPKIDIATFFLRIAQLLLSAICIKGRSRFQNAPMFTNKQCRTILSLYPLLQISYSYKIVVDKYQTKILKWKMKMKTSLRNKLIWWNRNIPWEFYQYHGYGCPGKARSQDICGHDDDYVNLVRHCLPIGLTSEYMCILPSTFPETTCIFTISGLWPHACLRKLSPDFPDVFPCATVPVCQDVSLWVCPRMLRSIWPMAQPYTQLVMILFFFAVVSQGTRYSRWNLLSMFFFINTLKTRKKGCHLEDNIFKFILFHKITLIWIKCH